MNLAIVVLDTFTDDNFTKGELKDSIERYCKYVWNLNNKISVYNAEGFFKWIKSDNSESEFENIDIVLFLEAQKNEDYYARRLFIENSMIATTANYFNFLDKLNALLVEYYGHKDRCCKLGEIKEKYKGFLEKIETKFEEVSSNKKLIKESGTETDNLNPKKFQELKGEIYKKYSSDSFHTIGHDAWRRVINFDVDYKKYYLEALCYDFSMCFAYNTKTVNNLKILVIDDNPSKIENDLQIIGELLGNNVEIFVTNEEKAGWKEFLDCNLTDLEIGEIVKCVYPSNNESLSSELELSNFTHIIVDLLYENQNLGNKIIRNLVKYRNYKNKDKKEAFFDIFVLSLSHDIEDIKRAIDEGALAYIFKDRIFQLPAYIAMLDKYRRILKERETDELLKHRNFYKLYRLPETIKRKLQSTHFLPPVETINSESGDSAVIKKMAQDLAYKWIKQIPKAELHFHIGGAMSPELIVNLSVNTLYHISQENNNGNDVFKKPISLLKKYFFEFLNQIDNPIKIFDAWKVVFLLMLERVEEEIKKCPFDNYVETIRGRDDCQQKIVSFFYEEITNNYNDLKNKIIEMDSEKLFFKWILFCLEKEKTHYQWSEDDVICVFNVIAGIYSGLLNEEFLEKNFLAKKIGKKLKQPIEQPTESKKQDDNLLRICEKIEKRWPALDNLEGFAKTLINNLRKDSQGFPNLFNKLLRAESRIYEFDDEFKGLVSDILKKLYLPKVRDKIEEVIYILSKNTTKSLKTYLRPAIFSGGALLQYYENIIIAIWGIAEKLLEDKVRYVEIRCAPAGYTKRGLSLSETVEALLDGADFVSAYKYFSEGEFIQINFIITGKKHKSPDKLAKEIATVVLYRERSLGSNTLVYPTEKALQRGLIYHLYPSRIVGMDLAGYEKGLKLEEFIEIFSPLFHTCSFITIHAGEEESAQYIWDAVFRLHAHRIGHGLRLAEHPFLLNMIRDLGIGIELCPESNSFTNPILEYKYPLYEYLKNGIACIINTDDPIFSGTDLSLEYVKAAQFYIQSDKNSNGEWLTKWEVLRLIKNSFKFAFLEKQRRRQLLRAAEEEIYQTILLMGSLNMRHFCDLKPLAL